MKLFQKSIYIIGLILLSQHLLGASLEDQALSKINSLNSLIAEAETKNIPTLHEKTTVRTAEVFLKFAKWDEANKAINTHLFSLVTRYKNDSTAMAELLPDFERGDVINMLDDAITDIQDLIAEKSRRLPVPNIDWSKASLEGDQISYEGKPVFLTDYTWKPETALLKEYHGQLDGYFLTTSYVEEGGNIKSNKFEEIKSKESGAMGFIFLNHKGPPAWAQAKYGPNFKMRENSYTNYDIDNPGARELQGMLLSQTVPYFKGKKYSELGYMLCNEPHFYVTQSNGKLDWASGPVSDYTIAKFRDSLATRHASIAELNTLWGTSFASFDEVEISLPIENSLQGTPMWYDWTTFNRQRVTSWFSDLRDTIQHYDADAKVHLKIMPNLWSNNKRGHGIDLEALTDLSEIIGNDASIDHEMMWGTYEFQEHYAYEWREVCMAYDFMKSVSPNKIILNTENHFLSTGRSRDLYQDPVHARSTFFLGHIWGLTANQIWFWPRREDGSPRSTEEKGYAGSNIHQPWLTNEVHTTNLDLNTFGEDIMRMQRQKKPIRIFFSKTSAINKSKHMDSIFELYETMVFDGVPIGFVSENILKKQPSEQWKVVCVYKTEYITQEEHKALQAYLDNGGTIITDQQSLKMDEYGRPLDYLDKSEGNIVYASNVEAIKTLAFGQLSEELPAIEITEENAHNKKLCLWKTVKNKEGKQILTVINVGNVESTINVTFNGSERSTQCTDMISGNTVENTKTLAPKEVYFVEVSEGNTGLSQVRGKTEISVYPNPTTGDIYFDYEGAKALSQVEVYNLRGQKVKSFSDVKKNKNITLDLDSGTYVLRVKGQDFTEALSIQNL